MNQIAQFIQEFEDAHHGTPWYGLNFHQIVDDITAKEALAVAGNGVSIARLVFHMIKWRKALSERLIGTSNFIASESDSDNWVPLNTLNEETWEAAKKEYDHQQKIIVEELKKRNDEFLAEEWKPGQTYRYLISGLIQHDIFHLGQISLIRSLLRNAEKQIK